MTKQLVIRLVQGAILCCVPVLGTSVRAQGTITFAGWAGWNGTSYQEQGLRFNVVVPQGTSYDNMVVAPAVLGPSNIPYNTTPYMLWIRQYNPYDYVSLNLTNGSLFGLSSVQLADPNSPSLSPVPISFIGYLPGGSTVTNTFTTPGNGATTFLNYSFTSEFAPGLTRVDILAPKWAMDNLVFVIPEPGGCALLGLGLLGFAVRRRALREA